jgi:hypothetical protein
MLARESETVKVGLQALEMLFAVGTQWEPAARAAAAAASQEGSDADEEQRTITQICEMLLHEGLEAYKKEGPRFMQRLVAKQKC